MSPPSHVSCNHSSPVCAVSVGMNHVSSSRTTSREQFSLQANATALKCGLIRANVSEPVRFNKNLSLSLEQRGITLIDLHSCQLLDITQLFPRL